MEYVAITLSLVGAEGINVRMMAGKNNIDKVFKLVCLEFAEGMYT